MVIKVNSTNEQLNSSKLNYVLNELTHL